jgi:tetratricopeptide (TPR) repeat protein
LRTLSRVRRFVLAGASLLVAGFVFRGPLSEALITRGDDELRFGDRARAIGYYDRALRVAPQNATAADRLAFFMALQHDRSSLEHAVRISTRGLAVAPASLELLADRAFAEMRLGRPHAAAVDFAAAGARSHDARYASFAARLARKSGDRALAQRESREALRDDPGFAPARFEQRKMAVR